MKRFLPGVSWALLVLLLSSLPASSMKLPQFWDLFSLDKLAHAVCYAILFLLFAYALRKYLLYIMVACIVYGILIELYQGYLLTSRTADWVDALANAIGVVIALKIFERRTQIKNFKF